MEIYSKTKEGISLIKSCSAIFDLLFKYRKYEEDCELVVITPHKLSRKLTGDDIIWQEIVESWVEINSLKSKLKIDSWKKILLYGEEVIPGYKIFKLKVSVNRKYFILIHGDNTKGFKILKDRLFVFNVWLHINNQRGLFHAAGIKKDEKGYLFFGPSGAGKSTVSKFSSDLGYEVIHDDHIVVFKSFNNTFNISDITLSFSKTPLRAVFFLVKDTKNELFQLSQADTAKVFMNSFLESMGSSVLYDNFIKIAFKVSSEIARSIPGFKLHFKKSLEFWELIHEKLET